MSLDSRSSRTNGSAKIAGPDSRELDVGPFTHEPYAGSGALQLSFTSLMINEVTLSPELVAADLRPVVLRLARGLRKETEQLGITARQATLLWLIRRNAGLSLAELAAEEDISPPALSGHVDRLEAAWLVERVRSDADRRRVGLRLTDEGSQLLRRVRARRTTWLAERMRSLTPAELEAIEAALPALHRLIGEGA
jgi:DNA-binding MarR family transcriptional regulator